MKKEKDKRDLEKLEKKAKTLKKSGGKSNDKKKDRDNSSKSVSKRRTKANRTSSFTRISNQKKEDLQQEIIHIENKSAEQHLDDKVSNYQSRQSSNNSRSRTEDAHIGVPLEAQIENPHSQDSNDEERPNVVNGLRIRL